VDTSESGPFAEGTSYARTRLDHADTSAGGQTGSEANSFGHRHSHGSARDEQDRMGINMFVLVTTRRREISLIVAMQPFKVFREGRGIIYI
jgi:hypothetical protein